MTAKPESDALTTAYARARGRLLPYLILIYALGFMDRVNVSYAQLAMGEKLAFTDAIYGFGAGILFIGYVLFEVPCNLCLARFGARRVIALIMVLWGIASALTGFIRSPMEFYIVRFMVGAFEAGIFPGILLYLSYWFPAQFRGRVVSMLLVSMLLGSMVTGPISGWILDGWDGTGGLANWQWLFILEGLPSVLFGVVTLYVLVDRPGEARWLNQAEKDAIAAALAADEQHKTTAPASHRDALLDGKNYILAFGLFSVLCGYYAVSFWMPVIIRANGVTDMVELGLYAVIPNVIAGVVMIANARHSDQTKERGWHFAIPLAAALAGLAFSVAQTESLFLSLLGLSVALSGVMSCFPTFWAIATAYIPAATAAFSIALINSVAAIGGFVSPYSVGLIRGATGSMLLSFAPMVAVMILGAIVMVTMVPKEILRGRVRPPSA